MQTLLGVHAIRQVCSALQLQVGHQSSGAGVGEGKYPAHALYRLVHDGQTKARARSRRACRIAPEERLGQVGQLFGGTPAPWSRSLTSTHRSRLLATMSTLVMPVSSVLP